MRARWTLGLLGLVPLSIWLAPRLVPAPVEVAQTAPVEAVASWREPEPIAPQPEILGTFAWDACTLRPVDLADALDRPDIHVRTGFVPEERLPSLYARVDQAGVPGLHLGFYTAPRSLEALRRYRDLRYLTFEGDHLDDAALEPLSSLRELRMLEMGVRPYEHNTVTDAGLRHLSGLRDLRYLGLHAFEGVTGEGLRYLMPLKDLRELELSYTRVDDKGLRFLASLKRLRTLSLQHTDVTDAGVAELRLLPELKTLDLRQTAVTPAIAPLLKSFPSLERVVLHHNLQHDVIDAVRAVGLQADGIGWIRGTVGCEHWPRLR